MKKFVILVLLLVLSFGAVFAKSKEAGMPYLKFNGSKYFLYYSAKEPQIKTYINEYYKENEDYANWSGLMGVHYYPNSYSPADHAKLFREYLTGIGCQAAIEVDENNDSAILDFVIIDSKRLPIILEFNVFKYEKSPVCGTSAIQYAERYLINNPLKIDEAKKSIEKSWSKILKQMRKIDIPNLVTSDIDKGKYVINEGISGNSEDKLNLD